MSQQSHSLECTEELPTEAENSASADSSVTRLAVHVVSRMLVGLMFFLSYVVVDE